MSGQIELSFEELPLVTDAGFDAGLVNGTATIRYHPDGDWSVIEICLDGHRERSHAEIAQKPGSLFEHKPVLLCNQLHNWLYHAILHQLEHGRFKDHIEAKIYGALEADREAA